MGILGYKKLAIGQNLMGVIKTVNDFDMVVSLPNQLTGFVSCDRISTALREKFSTIASSAASGTVSDIPSLGQFYQVGEIVVGTVISLTSPAPHSTATRRRIELSLLPDDVNKGVTAEAILVDTILVGEVSSHEDRGYTVKLGLKSGKGKGKVDLVGFLPDANAKAGLKEGKSLPLLVAASFDNKASRVITLTMNSETIAKTTFKGKADVTSLTCGTQISAEIASARSGSIVVSFFGHQGHVDVFNLPDGVMLRRHKELDLAEHFPVGKKITVRVVAVDKEEKQFWLTCKGGILSWNPILDSERFGQRIEDARVCRIDAKTGLVIAMEDPKTLQLAYAYVHISRLSDERVENFESAPRYKVGTKHVARLIDYDAFSAIYIASLKDSDIKATILRLADLHPGQTVRGEVLRVESYGVIVGITDRVRALCPTPHLTELQSEQAIKSYTVGQKYKFKVLDCDPGARKVTLTRKKGLLDSQLPVLSMWDQLVPRNQHDGYIVALRDFGCIVRFFGDVKGIVPVAEMSDDFVDRPQDCFFPGQVVRCRVVKCDPAAKELKLTFRKQTGPKSLPAGFKRSSSQPAEQASDPRKRAKPDEALAAAH